MADPPPKPARRRARRLLLLAPPLLVALFLTWSLLRRTLLDDARPVGGANASWNHDIRTLIWLTPTTGVAVRAERGGWEVLLVDLTRGTASPAPLTVTGKVIQGNTWPQRASLSPDGRWLLCSWINIGTIMPSVKSGFQRAPSFHYGLVRTDWSMPIRKLTGEADRLWMRDQPGWFEIDGQNRMSRVFLKPDGSMVRAASRGFVNGIVEGVTADGNLVIASYDRASPLDRQSDDLEVTLGEQGPDAMTARSWGAHPVFAGAGHGHPFIQGVSPDARRLAWLLETTEDDWMLRLPAIIRRSLAVHPKRRTWQLWTTATDGTRALCLGQLRSLPRDGLKFGSTPSHFAWSPDGRQMSFVKDDVLYVFPLPPSA